MGGATAFVRDVDINGKISIHAPRGGSDYTKEYIDRCKEISIHAPRGGSDGFTIAQQLVAKISIHAPRGGSDRIFNAEAWYAIDFNPRSPWGERLRITKWKTCRLSFQSTLPVGGATPGWNENDLIYRFQSTLPVGGATLRSSSRPCISSISIHAPRGGSDQQK